MLSKHSVHKDRWGTVSNGLTIFRILAAPGLVLLFYYSAWLYAWILFVIAASTDLLDGYLARALNQQSKLGTLLDPLADKCLLVAMFGSLTFIRSPLLSIPRWFFIAVLIREICMILGSTVALIFFKNVVVTPTWSGKVTTALQMMFLGWIFICYFMGWLPHKTYAIFLILLILFSLFSFFHYVVRFFSFFKK